VIVEYSTTEYSLQTSCGVNPLAEDDVVSATGLALATIASLIERPEPIPRGEIGRCLALLAETAAPDRPRQGEILRLWAQLLNTSQIANER
jgi:hypothetical protein